MLTINGFDLKFYDNKLKSGWITKHGQLSNDCFLIYDHNGVIAFDYFNTENQYKLKCRAIRKAIKLLKSEMLS
jgi:hypothetical protein